jgi:hypothetical protein
MDRDLVRKLTGALVPPRAARFPMGSVTKIGRIMAQSRHTERTIFHVLPVLLFHRCEVDRCASIHSGSVLASGSTSVFSRKEPVVVGRFGRAASEQSVTLTGETASSTSYIELRKDRVHHDNYPGY